MSLAAARAKRDDERALMRVGTDPVAERKSQRTEKAAEPKKTFRKVAADYMSGAAASTIYQSETPELTQPHVA